MTAIHDAATLDNVEALKNALQGGADVNELNKHGFSALMLAAWYGREASARVLIENGADVNLKRESGITALIWAISRGHAGIVRLLIDNGVDLDKKDNRGRIPLEWAVENRHPEIVKMLREAPAARAVAAAAEKERARHAVAVDKQRRLKQMTQEMKKRWKPS